MSYDGAIRAMSADALSYISDGDIIGLGSGRAATMLVRSLGDLVRNDGYDILAVPTSLQIKAVAEECGLSLIEADQADWIDVVFDGADQIDSNKYVIKGGGGALLRENILFSIARKIIVMADRTKFARHLNMPVPVEVDPHARNAAARAISAMGASPKLRLLERGYPFFTENGNIILDCDFGAIKRPAALTKRIKQIPGVVESGIFLRRPDIIYKARAGRRFDIIQ